MQIIENDKIKEKLYVQKLENGLTVLVIPKPGFDKKYIIWGTKYGAIDNEFVVPGEKDAITVPDGIAHFLEHKLFEQENGRNSLDVLSALGVNANAYTTNDHTAYLFECTDHFYEALDEFMDYVQHPYFTDENVEKEKGIIGQEISMYDDYPDWIIYMNAIKAMYQKSPVRIDITGTQETIAKIDKEILYHCYHTFYNPANMAMVICGDFSPEDIIEEIKKRLIDKKGTAEIKRIYPEEPEEIAQKEISSNMDISMPMFLIGFKDTNLGEGEMIKKDIAMQILLDMIMGKSSKLYQDLYNAGLLSSNLDFSYEFTKLYAHVLIQGQSEDLDKVIQKVEEAIEYFKENGFAEEDFKRIKKKAYGSYVRDYNDVQNIGNMFLSNYLRGIDPFDYFEEFETITKEYVEEVLRSTLEKDKMVISKVFPKK